MTTYVPFTPSPSQAFSFTATLDGGVYQMSVLWNHFGQRWYLACVAANNTLVFAVPLLASPTQGDINLATPYFSVSTLVFRHDTQTFEITP